MARYLFKILNIRKIPFYLACIFVFFSSYVEAKVIIQSSTSVKNSGLYDYLIPIFKKEKNISVYVVAVGTGAALNNAKNCDGDIVIVHAKNKEIEFVTSNFGKKRYNLMYNDFVIIGPNDDPANIAGSKSAKEAFKKIAKSKSTFLSRGDNSGTHNKEMVIWKKSQINPLIFSGKWYKETGAGQSTTLSMSVAMQAYALTDRASFISFKNKNNIKILVSDFKSLKNQYGIIEINEKNCPSSNHKEAKIFLNWILSEKGQRTISNFKLNEEQLFYTD